MFILYHTNKRERKRGVHFFYLTIPATIRMKRREGKRNKKGERGLKASEKKGAMENQKGKGRETDI